MPWLAVSLALLGAPGDPASATAAPAPPSVWMTGGSLYRGEEVHVGARPAAFLDNEADPGWDWGIGLTMQISTFALQ